jgi:hypothetical protein
VDGSEAIRIDVGKRHAVIEGAVILEEILELFIVAALLPWEVPVNILLVIGLADLLIILAQPLGVVAQAYWGVSRCTVPRLGIRVRPEGCAALALPQGR